MVALLESTHIMTKKIAFGQIVIVYVGFVIHSDSTKICMHPIHIAASTALGALAAVLALMVPYPRLACYEVSYIHGFSFAIYIISVVETLEIVWVRQEPVRGLGNYQFYEFYVCVYSWLLVRLESMV